jgi:hypothetical protein
MLLIFVRGTLASTSNELIATSIYDPAMTSVTWRGAATRATSRP